MNNCSEAELVVFGEGAGCTDGELVRTCKSMKPSIVFKMLYGLAGLFTTLRSRTIVLYLRLLIN